MYINLMALMSSAEAPSNVGGATSGGCGLRRLGHVYLSPSFEMWPFTDLEQQEGYAGSVLHTC